MTIVFFLLNWFSVNWFVCKSLCIQLDFFFNSCGSSIKHFLKLFSFYFGLSNSLNMFSVFINCRIFSLFFFFFCFFFCGVLCLLFCFFLQESFLPMVCLQVLIQRRQQQRR